MKGSPEVEGGGHVDGYGLETEGLEQVDHWLFLRVYDNAFLVKAERVQRDPARRVDVICVE